MSLLRKWLMLASMVSVCLVKSPSYTSTYVGAWDQPLAIYAIRGDEPAVLHLQEALRRKGHRATVGIVDSVVDPFLKPASVLNVLKEKLLSVIVLPWPTRSRIPEVFRKDLVSVGPTPPTLVHLVSKVEYGIRVSLNASDRKTLENKFYGLFTKGSPSEEDALNLFRAIGVYPCPEGGRCGNYTLDEQVELLLGVKIHAFFLTAHCPNSRIENIEKTLERDFDLVGIPPTVVEKMNANTQKPYIREKFDPHRCRYPRHKGVTPTAGVPGLYAARRGIPADVARDIATALVEFRPLPKDDFPIVIAKLQSILPLQDAAWEVYRTRLR